MYTLIGTAKLNDIDPQAWLADVLRLIADHPAPPGNGRMVPALSR
jgi:transposase